MNTTRRTKDSARTSPRRKKRPVVFAIAGAAVLVVVAGGLVTASIIGGQPGPAASARSGSATGPAASAHSGSATSTTPTTPSARPSAAPKPITTTDPIFGEPIAAAVPIDREATFGDAITARIVSVTPMDAKASRAGEVSGSAIRVELQLTNGTGSDIPLNAVTINAYYGVDRLPASPVASDPSVSPFSGTLATGATAKGTYVFTVPQGQQNSVVVTVSKSAGSPIVVFQ